jgi:hypothetical protein
MNNTIAFAQDLRLKMVEQIENIDKLILSLGIKELIPDFYENNKYKNISISLCITKNPEFSKRLVFMPTKVLEKRRGQHTVIINEQKFPADKVPDVIWEYAIEKTKKNNTQQIKYNENATKV